MSLNSWDDVVVRGSRDHSVRLGPDEFRLPADLVTMTAAEFRRLTSVYYDPERLRPIEGEYYDIASVFAPLIEVLARREWNLADVDDVLLAGGSAYLEPVVEAIEGFFGVSASHIVPVEGQRKQTEISTGAALQAFGLALTGEPLARPRSGEALVLDVKRGEPVIVVPGEVSLPWPDDCLYAQVGGLQISDARQALKIVLRRGQIGIDSRSVPLPAGAKVGDPFEIHASIDENQTVTLEVEFADGSQNSFKVERPFTYVYNPNQDREKILALEGQLTAPWVAPEMKLELRRDLAKLYLKVGHRDKALASAQIVLREAQTPGQIASGVYLTASAHADSGDLDEAFEVYRNAIEAGAGDLRFAFANVLDRRGRYEEALQVLDQIPGAENGMRLGLRGSILTGLDRMGEAHECFRRARKEIGHPRTANGTERSWLAYIAKQLGDAELLDQIIEMERGNGASEDGALPELAKDE